MQIERQLQIMNLLSKDGLAQVSQLSRRFGVSENTIRRDLRHLEDQGLVAITHGGAVSRRNPPMGMPLELREDERADEKRRIGERAASLVNDGESIIIDAGTTTERIVPALKGKRGVTVITNGINIALALLGMPGITTLLSGGILNDVTRCMAGFHAEEFISQFHVSKAFISAGGVTPDGVTNTNAFEVQVKRGMIASADVVALVVTHDKIGKVSLAPFAPIEDIDVIITDNGLDQHAIEPFRQRGVEVLRC